MKHKSSLIIYVKRKHSKHNAIIADLNSEGLTPLEIDLPTADITTCSQTERLNSTIQTVDMLIVYLSSETKNHACIIQAVELANKYGKNIVGIWLEETTPEDLCPSIGLYGDSITPYDEKTKFVFSKKSDVWLNPDYSTPPKTKTKKHTCG